MGTSPIPTYIAPFMRFFLRLLVLAVTAVVLYYGCDDTGVEPSDEVPVLSNPQTSYDDRNDSLYAAVTVTLPEGGTELDSIWTEMYLASGTLADSLGTDSLWKRVTLNDSAANGDILPLDGIYARKFDSPLPEGTGGSVRFEFFAISAGDTSSTTDSLRLANLRPVIVSVSARDTLTIPPAGSEFTTKDRVEAVVVDPDGLDDIKEVSFTIRNPDGSLKNDGASVSLVDNGILDPYGDEVAGDGTYSRISEMLAGATAGAYVYQFRAKDLSGAVSDTTFHPVVLQ